MSGFAAEMAHLPLTRPAVFLDRDGVLNRDSPDFVRSAAQFEMLPGAMAASARLSRAGFLVVVVTNQSGVARGLVTPDALEEMHLKLRSAVRAEGGTIDAVLHCPHLPDAGCECRKPRPGLVMQAAQDLGIDLARSYLVGDKPDDVLCGQAAGCCTVLVLSGQTRHYDPSRFARQPDHVAPDLAAAVDWVLERIRRVPAPT